MLGLKSLCLAVVAGGLLLFLYAVTTGGIGYASYPGMLVAAVAIILPLHVAGQFRAEGDRRWRLSLPGDPAVRGRLAIFLAVWILAIVVMPTIGFILAIGLAVTVSLLVLGSFPLWKVLPVVAVLVICVFALIERVLYVPMPRGPLEDAISRLLFQLAQGG